MKYIVSGIDVPKHGTPGFLLVSSGIIFSASPGIQPSTDFHGSRSKVFQSGGFHSRVLGCRLEQLLDHMSKGMPILDRYFSASTKGPAKMSISCS